MLLLELICITGFGGFVAFLSVKSPLLLVNIQFVSTNNHENAGKDPLGVCSSKHVQSMLHHVTPLFSCFNSHFFMFFFFHHFWVQHQAFLVQNHHGFAMPQVQTSWASPRAACGAAWCPPGRVRRFDGLVGIQWESFQPKNKLSICLYMVSTYSQIMFDIQLWNHILCTYSYMYIYIVLQSHGLYLSGL